MESTIPDSLNDTNPNYASDGSSECDDSVSEASSDDSLGKNFVENEDGDLELILFAKDEVGLRIYAVLASYIIVVIDSHSKVNYFLAATPLISSGQVVTLRVYSLGLPMIIILL